jgi:hypothetical protein
MRQYLLQVATQTRVDGCRQTSELPTLNSASGPRSIVIASFLFSASSFSWQGFRPHSANDLKLSRWTTFARTHFNILFGLVLVFVGISRLIDFHFHLHFSHQLPKIDFDQSSFHSLVLFLAFHRNKLSSTLQFRKGAKAESSAWLQCILRTNSLLTRSRVLLHLCGLNLVK